MNKETKINDEYAKLRKTLRLVPSEKIQMAEGLISNAAFMSVTLDELKDEINSRGALTTYNKNLVENPATKSYNTMINRYGNIMAQLFNLLPKEDQTAIQQTNPKEETLKKFIKKSQ